MVGEITSVTKSAGAKPDTDGARDRAAREKASLWLQLGLNNLSDYPTAGIRVRLDGMRQVRMDAGDNKAVAYIDQRSRQFYYQFEGNASGAAGYLAGPLPLIATDRQKAHLKQTVQAKLATVNLSSTMIKQPPEGYLNWPSVVLSDASSAVKQRAFYDPVSSKLYMHVTGPKTESWKPYWSGPIDLNITSLPRS